MGIIKPVELKIEPGIVERFSVIARKAFPNEALAYLLGIRRGRQVTIMDLYEAEARVKSNSAFYETPNSLPDAYVHAREEGLFVVGDVHSHPYGWADWRHFDPYFVEEQCWPSYFDWQGRMGHWWITGICRVLEHRGGRRTTKTAFYGPLMPVNVKRR